jgi:type II secretory pathway pseudopilin PulG
MKEMEAKLKPSATRCGHSSEKGFSMIELAAVVGIIIIILATAVFQLMPALQTAQADKALREALEQIRQAREYAVTNRRYVQITFPTVVVNAANQYQILTTVKNSLTTGAGADQLLSTVPIASPMIYVVLNALDTPDGFGNANPIQFNGTSQGLPGGMYFDPYGELVSGTSFLPINGSVFMGITGKTSTARAVTILGTSGRVRGWKSNGAAWVQF